MSDGGVPEGTFWTIKVIRPIMVQMHGLDPSAVAINDAVMDDATIPVSSYAPVRRVEPLRCPQCGADRDWTAFGAWTDPVRLVCPAGHSWTPWEGAPARGRALMQELILASGIEESRG
ncbi:hypothetical protein [Streptomyces noursei]|uniref:hypothetical protein n=1 Tax=Streptomyces noursei TaxID=1971 RepID=UPI00167C18EF|nr:hypothetical protein [Streptomyces noursei]MCZ1013923.1 hypothetical protein [Streptomyces noursei]GGX40845.1 hypothetical protein GCM10010341_73520 [Streptomyces noursei]